jgi:hypothetical protein
MCSVSRKDIGILAMRFKVTTAKMYAICMTLQTKYVAKNTDTTVVSKQTTKPSVNDSSGSSSYDELCSIACKRGKPKNGDRVKYACKDKSTRQRLTQLRKHDIDAMALDQLLAYLDDDNLSIDKKDIAFDAIIPTGSVKDNVKLIDKKLLQKSIDKQFNKQLTDGLLSGKTIDEMVTAYQLPVVPPITKPKLIKPIEVLKVKKTVAPVFKGMQPTSDAKLKTLVPISIKDFVPTDYYRYGSDQVCYVDYYGKTQVMPYAGFVRLYPTKAGDKSIAQTKKR